MDGKQIERSTDEARQGVTGHGVRYVLGISLLLAGIAGVALIVFYR